MKYQKEIDAELFRLVSKEGLAYQAMPDSTDIILRRQDGQEVGIISGDDLLIKPGYRATMDKVALLRENAREYVTAFSRATGELGLPNGYRKISDLGQYVLAAKQMNDSSYEFVTWQYAFDRKSVGHGNYFYDYQIAKTDFGIRTGMINRSRLFSETELEFLHGCLTRFTQIDEQITCEDERTVNSLLEKIEDCIPEKFESQLEESSEQE